MIQPSVTEEALMAIGQALATTKPEPETPKVGELVAQSLRQYAENLAAFIENTAEERLAEAQRQRDASHEFAASIREAAEIEATNSVAFIIRMQQAGLHLQEAMQRFRGAKEESHATNGGGETN